MPWGPQAHSGLFPPPGSHHGSSHLAGQREPGARAETCSAVLLLLPASAVFLVLSCPSQPPFLPGTAGRSWMPESHDIFVGLSLPVMSGLRAFPMKLRRPTFARLGSHPFVCVRVMAPLARCRRTTHHWSPLRAIDDCHCETFSVSWTMRPPNLTMGATQPCGMI